MILDGPPPRHVIDLEQYRVRDLEQRAPPVAEPIPMPGSPVLLLSALQTAKELRRMVETPRSRSRR